MLTKRSFYQYTKCPSWIRHGPHPHDEDALRLRLQEDGLLPEKEEEVLRARGTSIATVLAEDVDAAMQETLAYMRQGVQTIYRPTFSLKQHLVQPDFLERIEGASDLGSHYYVAGDIKRSRHVKPEYKMQGCFYAEALKQVQGRSPVQGYILHANGTVSSYNIDEYEVNYRLTKNAILALLDGEEEPHFLTSDCKQSPWFSACKADAFGCDDLSRLNRVWKHEVTALKEGGISTVSGLADLSEDEVFRKVSGITRDRIKILLLQARSLVSGRVHVLHPIDLPASETFLVVDIESDPLRDCDYLFGVLIVDGDTATYKAFLAKDPSQEQKAWEDFVSFMSSYIGYPIYHYGWSEQDTFLQLGEKYGTDKEKLALLAEQGVDLLVRLRESLIFPLSFYSLKDIAQFSGFSWRREDASGLNSVLWYESWLRSADASALEDVLQYNEDDVRATLHVLRFAQRHAK